MHAALISLILMSGACGQPPEAMPDIPPDVTINLSERGDWCGPPAVSVSVPPMQVPCGCGHIGCQSCNYPGNPMYRCCQLAAPIGPTTCPAWASGYRPACYFYPEHRMLFHPADYTMPYDYREQFNYPWHDPRCPCAALPLRN